MLIVFKIDVYNLDVQTVSYLFEFVCKIKATVIDRCSIVINRFSEKIRPQTKTERKISTTRVIYFRLCV